MPGNSDTKRFQIIDEVDGSSYQFVGLPGDAGFQWSKQVNWGETEIAGRSSPIYGYRSSGARTITLNIPLIASSDQNDGGTFELVHRWGEWLMSLAYPDYSNGTIKPPHVVRIELGDQIKLRCVVKSVSVTYKGPFEVGTGLSLYATAAVSVAEVDDSPKDYKQVRRG